MKSQEIETKLINISDDTKLIIAKLRTIEDKKYKTYRDLSEMNKIRTKLLKLPMY